MRNQAPPPPETERNLLPIDREIPPEFIDWERFKKPRKDSDHGPTDRHIRVAV